ncbi:MAG: hypothetical protein H6R07_1402 [Proteobacteria bacterium]|nr:hypothetical protein [Pseudomonadota bacterium]
MDATVLNQIQAASEKYLQETEKFLCGAEEQFQQVATHYGNLSTQYCEKEIKLEQARAVHRAVTAISTGLLAKYSDEVTLRHWLNGSFKLSFGK